MFLKIIFNGQIDQSTCFYFLFISFNHWTIHAGTAEQIKEEELEWREKKEKEIEADFKMKIYSFKQQFSNAFLN